MMIHSLHELADMLAIIHAPTPVAEESQREPTCSCAAGATTDIEGNMVCHECGQPYED